MKKPKMDNGDSSDSDSDSDIEKAVQDLVAEMVLSYAKADAVVAFVSNSLLLFYKLQDDVLVRICSFLSLADLFAFRSVSKRLKNLADIALENRHRLIIDSKLTRSQLKWVSNVSKNLTHITLVNFDKTFLDTFDVCEGKFVKVESLHLQNCWVEFLKVLPITFPNIKTLYIGKCYGDSIESNVNDLLCNLSELENITLKSSKLSAKCLKGVESQLKSLTWIVCGLFYWPVVELFSRLKYVFDLERLEVKVCPPDYWGPEIEEVLTTTFMKFLGFLKVLTLQLNCTIVGLDQWGSYDLEELSLTIATIDGSLCLMKQLYNLKRLHLDISRMNDLEMSAFLMNFPCVEVFSLVLTRNNDFQLSPRFVQCLSTLQKLRDFTFEDMSSGCLKKCVQKDNENLLLRLVRTLDFPRSIHLNLGYPIYEPIIFESFEEIASSRSLQQISLLLLTEESLLKTFKPPFKLNLSITFDASKSEIVKYS